MSRVPDEQLLFRGLTLESSVVNVVRWSAVVCGGLRWSLTTRVFLFTITYIIQIYLKHYYYYYFQEMVFYWLKCSPGPLQSLFIFLFTHIFYLPYKIINMDVTTWQLFSSIFDQALFLNLVKISPSPQSFPSTPFLMSFLAKVDK